MSTVPKRLLIGGFLAGFAVLWGVSSLATASGPFRLEDFLVSFVFAYAPVVGGALLVPWILLPIIANEPRRKARVVIAVVASLLPAAVALGGVTILLLGWDASPTMQVAICLSIAVWFLPAIGALACTAAQGAVPLAHESKKTNALVATIVCVMALLLVGAFSMPILAVAGWVTRTGSPSAKQVAYAREYLLINPELEIEPLAYYLKDGMDYMVRFKFIAKTNDPTQIFDRSLIDPSTFQDNFHFQPGEEGHNEAWWDISSRPLVGGLIRAPNGNHIEIGFANNDDDTFSVYVWRHE